MSPRPVYRPFGALRFGLALMVLLQHGLLVLRDEGRHAFYALELGAVAVAVFFALSGFIVAEAMSVFYAGRPVAFLANRALRVIPPYAAAFLAAVVLDGTLFAAGRLAPLTGTVDGNPLQPWTLLAGALEIVPGLPARRISGGAFSFIPFAWTLRVEFAFYMVAAAAGFAGLAGRPTACADQGVRTDRAAGLIAGGSILSTALVLARLLRHPGSGPTQLVNVPFFAFGLCAFLYRERDDMRARAVLAGIGCVALAAFPMCGQRGQPVLAIQLPLLFILFGLLRLLSRAGAAMPALLARWDRRLGELSYPLYISHGVALTLIASLVRTRGLMPYAATVTSALAFALVIHRTVEQPMRGWRDRLRGAAL
jgi:peptidoglycan/LPS O-acetylase OafA/YrhL